MHNGLLPWLTIEGSDAWRQGGCVCGPYAREERGDYLYLKGEVTLFKAVNHIKAKSQHPLDWLRLVSAQYFVISCEGVIYNYWISGLSEREARIVKKFLAKHFLGTRHNRRRRVFQAW